jgi:hypothetical protein
LDQEQVENYVDSHIGKAGIPQPAPDEYTHLMWALSFKTLQFVDDNYSVYHLLKDLAIKIDVATWFDKVKNGDRLASHLLLQDHYIGEAHNMYRAAPATSKLENLLWKSEVSV